MISPLIIQAADLAARVAENEIRSQAPSGTISGGTRVIPILLETPDGFDISFETVLEDSVKYGWYLDSGTLAEKEPNEEAEWNPEPGKGEGGIKPRYWTNLKPEAQARIDMIIEDAFTAAKEAEIEQMTNNI